MITIHRLQARQILDSRGTPTVECDVHLSDGGIGRAAVPSGASTGSREAHELRDGDPGSYRGKSVKNAINHIHHEISELVIGRDPFDQRVIDQLMRDADGTDDKSRFGANAILAVSLAVARACASSGGLHLHDYVASLAGTTASQSLPLPMMNIMNGGKHAAGATDFQEYMIIPIGAHSVHNAIEMGANVFHSLAGILRQQGYQTTVGDEGGYAPSVHGGNQEPFRHIVSAIETAGYQPGRDIAIGIDAAASEFYRDQRYDLATEGRRLSSDDIVDYYRELCEEFPIISIEDGLDENDWRGWSSLTSRLGGRLQLVGDDLLVTNVKLLQQAIEQRSANAILIKPNQIGTLSETIDAVLTARAHGWHTVISHRSGETEDTTIAHLAVGLGAGQIKTGSLSRGERTSKYNELMRIAENMPDLALARVFERN